MTDTPRTPLRETLWIIALSPFLVALGFHVPLLAWGAWQKLRVPYIVAMPLLFALEMAAFDWLFISDQYQVAVLLSHGVLLAVVILLSLIAAIPDGGKELLQGPRSLEGFLPAHLLFLLLSFVMPMILGALGRSHGTKP